ncbi:MAG: hypothetical protein P1V51_12555 [Deltaproteobacteria bacterium]|nr:hypothetical protein [Deltaproteobacteria bacterium]
MRTLSSIVFLSSLLLLVACPEGGGVPDGGGSDAGDIQDGGGGADGGATDAGDRDGGSIDGGGTVSCADPDAAFCLSNLDCGAGEICATDSTVPDDRCCAPGTPGSGQVNEPCTEHGECAFGLCIPRDDGQAFCSGECLVDLDCPSRMFCSDVFHWCVPMDTTVPIQSCDEVSLAVCFYNDNCSASTRCEDVRGDPADELLCCTVGARGTLGVGEVCASHVDCAFGRCLGGLCSELCDLDNDPCPPATMICNTIRGLCEPL